MPISDPDIWRAAKLLVDRHGQDAPTHAAQRMDELMASGDTVGWSVWKKICAAMGDLSRSENDGIKGYQWRPTHLQP
jgi:hypothetical protein